MDERYARKSDEYAEEVLMDELWTVEQAAAYWGVSESRARAILADRHIPRVSGYPADQIRKVQLRQGARTDLRKPD